MFNANRKHRAPAMGAAATSLIAREVTIHGDVQFSGSLHLDGTVEGAVRAAPGSDSVLTISETGRIVGRIEAPHAVINGSVQGDVEVGERLELAAMAFIEGDVRYQVLEMAAGARVNGKMIHSAPLTVRQLTESGIGAPHALTEA